MIQTIERTELLQVNNSSPSSQDSKTPVRHALIRELTNTAGSLASKAKDSSIGSTVTAQYGDDSGSDSGSTSGLYSAILMIVEMVFAIQDLQNANTGLLEKLSTIVSKDSAAEASSLNTLAAKIAGDAKAKNQEQLAADNAKFQVVMTTANNKIQTAQTQVQNYSSLVTDESKSISSDAQNGSSVIATLTDVAGLLR